MQRRIFLAAAAAGLVTARAASAETLIVHSPGDGFLNLRTGPGTRYAIIRQMDHGSRVETLEWSGKWVRVRHQSGAVGWAYAEHLRRPASPSRKIYSPRDGFLNLRTGPGTGYGIVMRMYNGERVEILDRSGKWRFVRHQSGAEGWAYVDYLVR